MSKLAMVAGVLLGATAVSAAPVMLIDGDGNTVGTYAVPATYVTEGQTVGGLGAAEVSFPARNNSATIQAANPRPILGDNTTLSAELYVDVTEVVNEWDFGGETGVVDHVVYQGIHRMAITFRNPDDGAQSRVWAGGPISGAGMDWFPETAQEWTTFEYDLTQEAWWVDGQYSTWEVFRVELYENDNIPNGATNNEFSNSYAIRNLQIVPEPGTFSLIGMGLGTLLLRRRR